MQNRLAVQIINRLAELPNACSCTGAREIRDPRETRISSELGTFMEQNATV